MRISDWSSDVCSSDLPAGAEIDFEICLGLLEVRIAEVEFERQPFIGLELGVPAAGEDRRVAMDDVVAHHRLGPRPGALRTPPVSDRDAGEPRRLAPCEREFDA